MKWFTIFCCVFLASVFLTLPIHASPIGEIHFSGDVDPLDPDDWNSSTVGYIGKTSDGSVEMFGGVPFFSSSAYLGYDSGTLGEISIDSGSTWTNPNELYVGYSGTGTIDITDGGVLNSSNTYSSFDCLGYNPGSSGTIHVDGAGSRWNNGGSLVGLCFGYSGNGTLRITHGGTATSNGIQCLLGYRAGSKGEITVDGPNSSWINNCSTTRIGDGGNGTLNILNGATVSNTFPNMNPETRLGNQVGSIGIVNVDGIGSAWTSTKEMYVGYEGSGVLNITNGATVTSSYRSHIGETPGSAGMVNVNGNDSTWTCGGLTVGYYGIGTLTITGGATVNGGDAVGAYVGSAGMVTVDGAGSTWNGDSISIGLEGTGILNITNGATVNATQGLIGNTTTSHATVSDPGSSLNSSGKLYIINGTLDVTDGATVTNHDYGYIGYDNGSNGSVTVDGPGSTWTNHSNLYVGNAGNGALSVTRSATLTSKKSYIAKNAGATGEVTINGYESAWNNEELYIGHQGHGTLNISRGTVTVEESTWVGYEADATGSINFGPYGGTLNTLTLYASSSQLHGTGTANVLGLVGDLDIVFDKNHGVNQTITLNDHPDQNVAINLDLSNTSGKRGDLGVGYRESGTMTIQDGILVESYDGHLGYHANATGVVTVSEPGSTWKMEDLDVGRNGSGTIHITDGGTVFGHDINIGYATDSTGLVTVDGPNSALQSDYLDVGRNGEGTLRITNGGAVGKAAMGGLSCNVGSHGTLIVDGTGSTLTTVTLDIDSNFDGGFQVIHGASANTSTTYIDFSPSDPDMNAAKVEGDHSVWTTGTLYVGRYNNQNYRGTLSVSDRGTLNTRVKGIIGQDNHSTGVVTVDGIGSTWNNDQDLLVGNNGAGELNILGGGLVRVAGNLTIDDDEDNDSFVNMATGGMLALLGNADDSLGTFFDLIDGTDAIRWWNPMLDDWDFLTNASANDYSLQYMAAGDLAGYTLLTVGAVPEPGGVALLATLLMTGLAIAFLRQTR